MNYYLTFTYLFISLISSIHIYSMTEKEFSERYPWKVDALCYVKKPDGTIVAQSIYKDEEAAVPQPRRDQVSESLKQHIKATMDPEVAHKARLIKLYTGLKSLLIIGPTGSGKTSLASAIANQMGQSCTFYDCRDLIGRWRNSASVNIQKILNPIEGQKDKPQTIILDNIEEIIVRHNDGGDNGVWTLCAYLDGFEREGHKVCIIGITNNNVDIPWKLPYRFCNTIHIDLPDINQREQAFSYHMKEEVAYNAQRGTPMTYDSSITPAFLAKRTDGLCHYELQYIVREMHKNAALRRKKTGADVYQDKTDQEMVVMLDDALKPIDVRKPYAALARKATYYTAVALALCATLYSFKALYFNCRSFVYKN